MPQKTLPFLTLNLVVLMLLFATSLSIGVADFSWSKLLHFSDDMQLMLTSRLPRTVVPSSSRAMKEGSSPEPVVSDLTVAATMVPPYDSTSRRPAASSSEGGIPSRDRNPCMWAAGALRGEPASRTTTLRRARESTRAADSPAAPPPTMITSYPLVSMAPTVAPGWSWCQHPLPHIRFRERIRERRPRHQARVGPVRVGPPQQRQFQVQVQRPFTAAETEPVRSRRHGQSPKFVGLVHDQVVQAEHGKCQRVRVIRCRPELFEAPV